MDNSGGMLISPFSGGGSNLLAEGRGGWKGKMSQIVKCGDRENDGNEENEGKCSGIFYVSVVSIVMESAVVFVVTEFALQNHPAIGRICKNIFILCGCTHHKYVQT